MVGFCHGGNMMGNRSHHEHIAQAMMQPSFPGASDVPEIFSDVPEMPNLRKTGKSDSKAFTHAMTSDGKRSQNSLFSSEGFNGQGYIL